MRLRELQWDAGNIEHIARHGVSPEEAEEACRIAPKVRRARLGRHLVLGRTEEGRYLAIVVIYGGAGAGRVITARDMTDRERAIYRRK